MMTGIVNARLEAMVPVRVVGDMAKHQDIDAMVDIGFDGALTLPTSVIALLGLPWYSHGRVILANGQIEFSDVHEATVIWDSLARQIFVYAIDAPPLLGTALLAGHDLRIRMVPGGSVEIEPGP